RFMPVDTAATLSDLVTQDPRRGRVLERFDLDYCCNGQRSLADAVSRVGLDMTEIAAALDLPAAATAAANGKHTNGDLAHDIVDTHHAYMWEEMPRLATLVAKVDRVHGGRHPELAAVHDAFDAVGVALEPHMTKEERSVF